MSARPYDPEAFTNLAMGSEVLVLLHSVNESSIIDREVLQQFRGHHGRDVPVVVLLVHAPGAGMAEPSAASVRGGLGLPADAPVVGGAMEAFEHAVSRARVVRGAQHRRVGGQ